MQVAAFRATEAAYLAPFKYSLLLWSIAIAYAVWAHVPESVVIGGAGIIVIGGFISWFSGLTQPARTDSREHALVRKNELTESNGERKYDDRA